MANIFKTTLKKDVIADIANNDTREIRFPITKFWATRLTDEYNLDDKTFTFKIFDSLEVSSPSNKDTEGETFVLDFVRTYVDGDEFVVEFKMGGDDVTENISNDEFVVTIDTPIVNFEDIVPKDTPEVDVVETDDNESTSEVDETFNDIETADINDSDVEGGVKALLKKYMSMRNEKKNEYYADEIVNTPTDKSYEYYRLMTDEILNNFYEDSHVISTFAARIVILPNGKVLGTKKSLPVNNDAEIYVDFDMCEKIYLDTISVDVFTDEVLRVLGDIRKNNFVFVRKRDTGLFIDVNGRVYFGIKYATRRSVGFNRRYNVQ